MLMKNRCFSRSVAMKGSASTGERVGRDLTNLAAFVFGLPAAAMVLGVIAGPLQHTVAARYVHHPVEQVEVAMFCVAAAGLLARAWRFRSERLGLETEIVPAWDGKTVAAADAGKWLPRLNALPARLQRTLCARRVRDVLSFLVQRRSAAELDDQLRSLADADAAQLDGSYALTRFITWAIPILGFIGTVLGITQSIGAVTPDDLEKNLDKVTGGLAFAFDATALGLSLTMAVMFLTFLVERVEHGILAAVDRAVEEQLGHRFQRHAADSAPFLAVVQQTAETLLEATGRLVERQAEVWSQALAAIDKRVAGEHDRTAAAIAQAVERTLTAHGQRLEGLEKQTAARLGPLVEQVASQAATLARLLESGQQLVQLQGALQQNLAALAGAGSFEQAVHTLTAAIHLLTARAAAPPPAARSGKAA
jgi:biopolymer transport protein ExbB/TolQ